VPTPDFEEWLRRQDFPVEETVTLDRFLDYLERELGVHGGSLDVASEVYEERFEIMEELGVRPLPRIYFVRGELRVETRYAVSGAPGLWGRETALRIAEERAYQRGLTEWAEIMRSKREEEFGE
jgi:hypothetical protein